MRAGIVSTILFKNFLCDMVVVGLVNYRKVYLTFVGCNRATSNIEEMVVSKNKNFCVFILKILTLL